MVSPARTLLYSLNLTPDNETGIGKRTDCELARLLRFGVGHDGRAVLPFMPFNHLSDEDLTAVCIFRSILTPNSVLC